MKTTTFNRVLCLLILFVFISTNLYTQNVAITDDDGYSAESTAMLDIKSTSKGLLVPRLDSLQRVGIVLPATGLLVFDTDANAFFYYDGADWLNLTTNVISPASATVNDLLFSVINIAGDTVFAVYPEGVRINVGDGVGKANKGGFAVGGLASGKAGEDQYLYVTPDSVRVYVDPNVKANKGGFAVGGLASGKSSGGYFHILKDNYFIGHESGSNITTGLYNSFFGYQAGKANTEGSSNIFIGNQAGLVNEDGFWNVFIGNTSGISNISGYRNTFVGYATGRDNTTGALNTFIGNYAGLNNTEGLANTILGNYAGNKNTTGDENVFVGQSAGAGNLTGNQNIYIGRQAGYNNESGIGNVVIGTFAGQADTISTYNVFIGYQAANNVLAGTGNVVLGNKAGYNETSLSNKLIISNNSTTNLIEGDFSAEDLRFNANVGINVAPDASYDLKINGDAFSIGGTWGGSDLKWKKNISDLNNVLKDVNKLKPVSYDWKVDEYPEMNFSNRKQIGLIAQELEKVFPELVKTDEKGNKAISYEKLSVILLKSIQEQQQQIDDLKKEIESLKR